LTCDFWAKIAKNNFGIGSEGEESGSRVARMTHLSDDETVAKMGHPGLWWFVKLLQ